MKKILYVIVALVVIYLILCIIGPAKTKVARSVAINAPVGVVKTQLLDFQFFRDKWSPFTELDPNMKSTYEGTVGTPGYKYHWEGNKDVGKGSMEYLGSSGDTMKVKLQFIEPWEGISDVGFIASGDDKSTTVTWAMESHNAFFTRPMMLFMNMDKMLGTEFEKGLNKLKTVMESMATEPKKYNGYEIHESTWEAKSYVGKRAMVKFDKMSAFFADNFPKIFAELGKAKVQPLMAPSALFFMWDEANKQADCAAVACVPAGTTAKGWETFNTPAGQVLHIAYYGSYEKSMDAHMAMDAYMKEKNLQQSVVIEEYVTDPMTEKDTAKWLTNIYYLVSTK